MKDYIPETLKELMDKFDEYRALWINTGGDDEGFSEWFTAQVLQLKPTQ